MYDNNSGGFQLENKVWKLNSLPQKIAFQESLLAKTPKDIALLVE